MALRGQPKDLVAQLAILAGAMLYGFAAIYWLARFGKQMWLMVWSVGLVLSSIIYIV